MKITSTDSDSTDPGNSSSLLVDVIIPVHNASTTIEQAVRSAMTQVIPQHLQEKLDSYSISVTVCCYDDMSADNSWEILQRLQEEYAHLSQPSLKYGIYSNLLLGKSSEGRARGAGFARNRAVALQTQSNHDDLHFLCLLDSDDTMYPHRIAEQVCHMLSLTREVRERTLLGCQFDRYPQDSTWHYSQWANSLEDDRLLLERFREVTILQPTWFLCRKRFLALGGYVEGLAPPPPQQQQNSAIAGDSEADLTAFCMQEKKMQNRLVHPIHDTRETLLLAEDLRFFHDHLDSNGSVRLHRTTDPLVTYRHTGTSQSFRTSRMLLLQLRVLALERSVLRLHPLWQEDQGHFVIWGAGRDGKHFYKALSDDLRCRVYCFVEVDEKKLEAGRYIHPDLGTGVPIVHFSLLIGDTEKRVKIQKEWELKNQSDGFVGRINKGKPVNNNEETEFDHVAKRQKSAKCDFFLLRGLDPDKLQRLPVVVCVAMHRTAGILERNVELIGRKEGLNLWHFN